MNLYLFNYFHSLAGLHWSLNWLVIFLGTFLGPLLFLLAIVFCLRNRSFKIKFSLLSFLILSILIALIIVITLRVSFENPRPFIVLNFHPLINEYPTSSFPSEHTTVFASLAFGLWFINRKAGYWFLLGSLLIGIGRIIAGVHWPVDIVGGLLFGIISALIAHKLFPHKEFLVKKTENSR